MKHQIEALKKESQRIEALPMFAKLKPSEQLIAGVLSVVDQLVDKIEEIERGQDGES